jgi:hypothetical protein
MKVQADGRFGSYYRHAVGQAVLYPLHSDSDASSSLVRTSRHEAQMNVEGRSPCPKTLPAVEKKIARLRDLAARFDIDCRQRSSSRPSDSRIWDRSPCPVGRPRQLISIKAGRPCLVQRYQLRKGILRIEALYLFPSRAEKKDDVPASSREPAAYCPVGIVLKDVIA